MWVTDKSVASTGHEDATEDFGIYEFVSIPGKMESAQVRSTHPKLFSPPVEQLGVAVLISLCNRSAGVVQVAGAPGISSGCAHHHLRCHSTRSRDALPQLDAELRRRLGSPPLPPGGCGNQMSFCTKGSIESCVNTQPRRALYLTLGRMPKSLLLKMLWDKFVWPHFSL